MVSVATLRYAALNAAFWAGFALLMAFAGVFLLERGLTNTQIGIVLAAAGAASAILQPVVAGLADRSRVPLRVWISALAVVMIGLSGALLLPGASPLRDGILFGLLQGTLQVSMPLINASGMAAVADGAPVDFGTSRAAGSLSFAALSLVLGGLVMTAGADLVPLLTIVVECCVIAAALTFVFGRGTGRDGVTGLVDEVGPLTPAARRLFVVLVLGVTGLTISQAVINSFMIQVLKPIGGDAGTMGSALTLAAVLEIIPMLAFGWLVRRWPPATLLRVSAVVFAIKAVLTWLAPNLAVFFVAQALQIGAFALFVPASVYYVERLMPASERARGQSYMTLTITLGNVVAGLFGGYMLDALGVPALLLGGAVAASVGAVAVFAGTATSKR